MHRRRRTSQAGQVVVITVLMATVIFGAMALTVDLSLHTYNQRTLQNVADAGALAGATDLGISPTSAQQKQGLDDALAAIRLNPGFSGLGSSPKTPCTNGSGFSGYCETVPPYQSYTVKLSAPPQAANGSSNHTTNDLEVDISVNVNNNFGAFVGMATSTVAAHAVAYNSGPPNPYNYTFFSASHVESGNQQESIVGDAFVGNGYAPQSSGQDGLCVYEISGTEPTTDSDNDAGAADVNDVDDQGHAVFGAVPPTVGGDPTYGQTAACPNKGAFTVQQPAPLSAADSAACPTGSTPTQDTNTGAWLCYVLNPPVPPVTLPSCPGPGCQGSICAATLDSTSAPGIYPVQAGCTVTLDFSNTSKNNGSIACVDLLLGTGSHVSVSNKKNNNYMTSWGFNPAGDTVANQALHAVDPTWPLTGVGVPACGGASSSPNQADDCVICAQPTTASPMPLALQNNLTGCCSDTLFVGSVFLPGQEISFATNQAMEDVGEIYCGDWQVQSGNHPNPLVQHDSPDTSNQAELLRLVE
jgi:Flp pilus assembly protein TadG